LAAICAVLVVLLRNFARASLLGAKMVMFVALLRLDTRSGCDWRRPRIDG